MKDLVKTFDVAELEAHLKLEEHLNGTSLSISNQGNDVAQPECSSVKKDKTLSFKIVDYSHVYHSSPFIHPYIPPREGTFDGATIIHPPGYVADKKRTLGK